MVIVDEAHHLRNNRTMLWKFLSQIQKKYILLLTATPIQNSLHDLYNLVTLLKPGLLSTAKNFKKRFVNTKDPFRPKNVDQLHDLIAESMVRNRRSTIGVHFTRRYAKTFRIPSTEQERTLYQDVSQYIKEQLISKRGLDRMTLFSLQKMMGSTHLAVLPSLERMMKKLPSDKQQIIKDFAFRTASLNSCAKIQCLLQLVREVKDKIVIFTQFRQTQNLLFQALEQASESVVLFHGSLTRMQKEEAIQSFSTEKRILLSTDSGSEGRNLQFCNYLCNFDLPWNPMRIEQRIGRLSRIGQKRDVHIFNLVSSDTIEDHVLYILEAKVNLFEMVMGEMDMILGNLDEEVEFEDKLIKLWTSTECQSEFQEKIEDFGEALVQAKEEYLQQQEIDDKIFGDKFSAKG